MARLWPSTLAGCVRAAVVGRAVACTLTIPRTRAEFYTLWLSAPSLVGALLFLLQVWGREIDHPLLPLYSLFMALWATLFLVSISPRAPRRRSRPPDHATRPPPQAFWRRRSAQLAMRWGVLHHEEEERERPQFRGESKQDAVTKQWEVVYPTWRRNAKRLVRTAAVRAWSGLQALTRWRPGDHPGGVVGGAGAAAAYGVCV